MRDDDSTAGSGPPSPTSSRRFSNTRKYRGFLLPSASDLETIQDDRRNDEHTPLLKSKSSSGLAASGYKRASDGTLTPKPRLSRHASSSGSLRHHSRKNSWGARLVSALRSDSKPLNDYNGELSGSQRISVSSGTAGDDRVWYDQFTSTDWVHDNIADAYRLKELRSRKDFRGRLKAFFDGSQGWILAALVGCVTATIAYSVDVLESPIFDYKEGYCSERWYLSEKHCCPNGDRCDAWRTWSEIFSVGGLEGESLEFLIYVMLMVLLATISCLITLTTKTVVPSTYKISTFDENLAALPPKGSTTGPSASNTGISNISPRQTSKAAEQVAPPMIYYTAAGSGVAEVKVILSGFVLHGYLGLKTLLTKTSALVFSVASGLSLGKEGPFVHIAACVGNIACRLFDKYDYNDGKRREILSAAAASGVAVAFGAPIGGVLFSLEETAYFFPAKTLFRTFFCCITAALSLKFLNPYGTGKIVMFEVRYLTDWELFEMVPFLVVAVIGGASGALFIKASSKWARTFRKIPAIKKYPLLEVVSVAAVTGLTSYWNEYTKAPVAKLLFNLARPCRPDSLDTMGLCPQSAEDIPFILRELTFGFVVKALLTIITFGIKMPSGIYVPSMVVGGLMGRFIGHCVQSIVFAYPNLAIFEDCAAHPYGSTCVTPGVYALIGAGATMCGVTRLSITLAVILFELTGSLDYVLPFSLSILAAKWTADAIEPLSIYVGTRDGIAGGAPPPRPVGFEKWGKANEKKDLLTNMNSYPFLNNKTKPIFTDSLSSITPRIRSERLIDISHSPLIPAKDLREKIRILHQAGELDGGLPIVRHSVLVGLIPAPDLEFALDSLPNEEDALCLMFDIPRHEDGFEGGSARDEEGAGEVGREREDPTDFTPYIDPAPVALEVKSAMDLVYECFAKLGLRYVCVVKEGRFAGLLHRKVFVKYVRELEERERGE